MKIWSVQFIVGMLLLCPFSEASELKTESGQSLYSRGVEQPSLRYLNKIGQEIYTESERSFIENENSVSMTVAHLKNCPVFSEIKSTNDADLFYAQQSYWDFTPYNWPGVLNYSNNANIMSSMDCKHDCKKLFFAKFPDLKGKVVLMHLIRPVDLKHCPGLEESDVHSVENLKAIFLNNLNNPDLDAFRRERTMFYTKHASPTADEIKNEAKSLKSGYKKLFATPSVI